MNSRYMTICLSIRLLLTEEQLLVTIYFSHTNTATFKRKFLKNAEGIEITGTNQHNNWSNAR
jgi:hypothetical protein